MNLGLLQLMSGVDDLMLAAVVSAELTVMGERFCDKVSIFPRQSVAEGVVLLLLVPGPRVEPLEVESV